MDLLFEIKNQIIKRHDDNRVVADSKNYLFAHFSFSEDWVGTKTAIFKHENDTAKEQLLDESGSCVIPSECIKRGELSVSCFCGDLITANKAYVNIEESGLENGTTPQPPTEDIYDQILKIAESAEEKAESVVERANRGEFNGEPGKQGEKGDPGKDAVTDNEFSLTSQNAIANYVVTKAFANGKCKGLRLYNSLTDLRTMREELNAEDEFFVAFTTVDKVEGTDAGYIGISIVSSNDVIDLNSTETLITIYNLLSAKPGLAQLVKLTSTEELGTLISNPDSFPFIARIDFKPAQSEINPTSLNEDADLEQGDFVIFYDIKTTDIIKKSTLTQIKKPLDLSSYPTRRKAMPRNTLMALGTGMYEVFNEGYIGYSAVQGTIYCPKGSTICINVGEQAVSVLGVDYYYIEDTEDLEYWRESFAFTWHDFNSSIADYSNTEEVKSLIASSITGVLEGAG